MNPSLPLSPEFLLIAEACLLAIPFTVLFWWQGQRRKRLEAYTQRLETGLRQQQQSLACAPDGWFQWTYTDDDTPGDDGALVRQQDDDPTDTNLQGQSSVAPQSPKPNALSTLSYDDLGVVGGGHCSRRLAILLSLYQGRGAAFTDVLDAFPPTMAHRLLQAALSLRQNGEGFDITLPLQSESEESARSGQRVLRVWGIRAVDDDGTPLADLIWMRDVSAESALQNASSAQSQALEQDRARFQGALDALPAPVWVRDANLGIVFANKAFLNAVEASDVAQVQAEDRELASGTAGRELRALASAARASGAPRQSPIHVVLDGRRRLLEITETPLPGGTCNAERATVGAAFDMTRLETLRSTLEQEATSHAMVLHRLGTAIAIFGGDRRLHFNNTAFAKLWHLEDDWLQSSPTYGEVLEALRSRRLLPEVADYPAFKDAELARFKSLLESVEDLLHLPDGKTLRRVLTPHPLGGLLATYEDVTDRLALEASYNQLIAVQRETLDHLHESVAVFGADGRLRLCNPAFQRLWRLDQDLIDRQPHLSDLGNQDASLSAPWEELRTHLVAPPQGRIVHHDRMTHGQGVTLDTLSVPLPDGGILFTALDMSDTARVEKALRERAHALSAADRQKSQFMANISYELRTPLTTILGFAEILAEEYYGGLNPRQRDYARTMAETAHQLVRLIDDISDLVSLEAGKAELRRSTFDIHAALASVLGLTREMVRAKGQTINFDCPAETGTMGGDEGRIKQVLYNLLTNAIKYTPNGGQIIFAAMRQKGEVVFTIADTGIGISEEDQVDIFDRFQRVGPGEGGAGVGLALVKRFVDLHGGRVELESVPGEGTTVFVHIPDLAQG
jgi:signal transduction histidine kinase